MTAEEARQIEQKLHTMRKKELVDLVQKLLPLAAADDAERMALLIENDRMMTSLSKAYQKLEQRNQELAEENAQLKAALVKTAEAEQLKKEELFGRSTESLESLLNGQPAGEETDEADTDSPAIDDEGSDNGDRVIRFRTRQASGERRKKQAGKKERDLSRLPHERKFIINTEELDRKYGKDNWYVAFWDKKTSVEHVQVTLYAVDTYTPVAAVGPYRDLHTVAAPPALIPGSVVSPSLMAWILFMKFFLGIPLYRQEFYFANAGYPLTRQTLSSWVVRLAAECFAPIVDYLKERLLETSYHQCDETTYRVLRDGRSAASKSYIWVHTTSELLEGPPLVVFCYELTRGTDHLRKFYEDFKGYITCDAYCSYQVLEKENEGVIFVCGCMMHMRRRYANSLELIDTRGMTGEQIEALPEVKALRMIAGIYAADEALKDLSAQERTRRRGMEVRPLVEEYYEFIESIDTADLQIRNRLKDAVNYSLNQKEHLCRFLEDGNIPIDDGNSERKLRPLCLGRKNFLFCNTIEGAIAMATMYSIVETAKANKANVLYYLQYVLERMPKHLAGTDPKGYLPSMVPWSDEYRAYERRCMQGLPPDPKPWEFDSEPAVPRKPPRKMHGKTA